MEMAQHKSWYNFYMLILKPKHYISFFYQGKGIFFVWTHQNGRFGLDFFFLIYLP